MSPLRELRLHVYVNGETSSRCQSEADLSQVFLGTPHHAPDLATWSEVFTELVSITWQIIPKGFLETVRSLPKFLEQTSTDFIEIAFRVGIVSVLEADNQEHSSASQLL